MRVCENIPPPLEVDTTQSQINTIGSAKNISISELKTISKIRFILK